MKRTALNGILISLSLASAALAQERSYVVAGFDTGQAPAGGGVHVLDTRGKQRVLRGGLAVELVGDEGVISVGAVRHGDVLEARWVRAYAGETIETSIAGSAVRIRAGTALKVIDRKDDPVPPGAPEYYETSFRVELKDGRKVWLSTEEHRLSFEPKSRSLQTVLASGRVVGGKLQTFRHGEVRVVGALAELVAGAEGRVVEGYGVLLKRARVLHLSKLEATTVKDTAIHRTADAASPSTPRRAYEGVQITAAGTNGFHQVRYNWPGIGAGAGVAQSFVLAADVEIGTPWVEDTGRVIKTPGGRLAIELEDGQRTIAFGGTLTILRDKTLEPLLGQTVTVAGDVVTKSYGQELRLRELRATLTREVEGAAAGTRVRVTGLTEDHGATPPTRTYALALPGGKTASVPAAAIDLRARRGAAGALGGLGD